MSVLFEKSFASMEESKYWDHQLNGDLKPENIMITRKDKVWLKCPNSDHVYQIIPANIYYAGSGCSYPCCKGKKKLCDKENCKICFDASFASHKKSKFWSYELNKDITPRKIFKSSDKHCYFNCDKSGHIYRTKLCNVNNGTWCSYPCCANQTLCDDEKCKICFDASFASSEYCDMWDDTLNKIKSRSTTKFSDKKFWFICRISGHSFNSRISSLSEKGTCPYPCCTKENVSLCGKKECKVCFSASFASSEYCKYWDCIKNKENPLEISKSSNRSYWFKCNKHEFKKEVYRISRGNLCGFKCCDVNSQILCEDETCETCFNLSFASVPQIKYLDQKLNSNLNPRKTTKYSHIKAYFKCEKNHSFCSVIYGITKGFWCPYCTNKSENECREIIEAVTGKKFDKTRLKILNSLELDGYNKELNLAFEHQGIQHYVYHPNFFHHKGKHIFLMQLLRDEIKKRLCKKNGIKLIIIPYNENKELFIKNKLIEFNVKI